MGGNPFGPARSPENDIGSRTHNNNIAEVGVGKNDEDGSKDSEGKKSDKDEGGVEARQTDAESLGIEGAEGKDQKGTRDLDVDVADLGACDMSF